MGKRGPKKPQNKLVDHTRGTSSDRGVAQLTEQLVEVAEEIEMVSGESSTLEDIEGAKVLASEVLDKYSTVLNRLGPPDRIKLEQSIGPVVERIKHGFALLKEAPE
jgi:hypothetical protein